MSNPRRAISLRLKPGDLVEVATYKCWNPEVDRPLLYEDEPDWDKAFMAAFCQFTDNHIVVIDTEDGMIRYASPGFVRIPGIKE